MKINYVLTLSAILLQSSMAVVLIDPVTRNGGFESGAAVDTSDTFAGTEYWTNFDTDAGDSELARIDTNFNINSEHSGAWGGLCQRRASGYRQPTQDTSYTIQEGDRFKLEFYAAGAWNFDPGVDKVRANLFAYDDDGTTLIGVGSKDFVVPANWSYTYFSTTFSPVASNSPAIGRNLHIRFLPLCSVGEGLFLDDIRLTANETNTAETVDIWLLGGQSNMRGHGNPIDLTEQVYQLPQYDVMFWHNQHNEVSYTGSGDDQRWEVLSWGAGLAINEGVRDEDGGFGPELSFGRMIADVLPGHQVALIKHAIGGTNLGEQWNAGEPNGPIYSNFLQTVHAALGDLESEGINYNIRGMLWMQGENDTSDQTYAENYAANLQVLVDAVREEFNVPAMAFLLGRIRGNGIYTDTVRSAQETVAGNNSLSYWIDVDDLPLVTYDTIHLNTDAQIEFGKRLADAYLNGIYRKNITASGVVSEGGNNAFWIHWPGHTGEVCQVLSVTNLLTENWNVETNLAETAAWTTEVSQSQFFRIELK